MGAHLLVVLVLVFLGKASLVQRLLGRVVDVTGGSTTGATGQNRRGVNFGEVLLLRKKGSMLNICGEIGG